MRRLTSTAQCKALCLSETEENKVSEKKLEDIKSKDEDASKTVSRHFEIPVHTLRASYFSLPSQQGKS